MRTEEQVKEFCYRHKNSGDASEKYKACIPGRFWNINLQDFEYSKQAIKKYIIPYSNNLLNAVRDGYGLCLVGDNGSGKTAMLCYVLCRAVESGYSGYYTTVSQMEYDFKRGFSDNSYADHLEEMLQSHFLCIDELLKEKYKDTDSWMRTQLERILKSRNDNKQPTLLASNKDINDKDYGATLTSIISGCFEKVVLEPGDYRPKQREQMRKAMGW